MRFLVLVFSLLFAMSALSNSPLDPRNSKIPTLDFTYKDRDFSVGIWASLQGDIFALVTDRGDGVYVFLGSPKVISMDDIGGQIESFGGIEEYIKHALNGGFISWNDQLQELINRAYPGFSDYIKIHLYFDEISGKLILD